MPHGAYNTSQRLYIEIFSFVVCHSSSAESKYIILWMFLCRYWLVLAVRLCGSRSRCFLKRNAPTFITRAWYVSMRASEWVTECCCARGEFRFELSSVSGTSTFLHVIYINELFNVLLSVCHARLLVCVRLAWFLRSELLQRLQFNNSVLEKRSVVLVAI